MKMALSTGGGVPTTTDSSGAPAINSIDATSSNKVLIDDNVDGNQYIGTAPQGSATSASVWAITKNDNGAPVQTFTHSQPDQIWDNRTSGTYT